MEPEPEPEPLLTGPEPEPERECVPSAGDDDDVLSWDLTCSICLDAFNDPVRTPCGHLFCRPCITEYIRSVASAGNPPTCPHDREPLAASDLVPDHETARLDRRPRRWSSPTAARRAAAPWGATSWPTAAGVVSTARTVWSART